ncbi:MAG: RNA polymerase sigma factor [Phycisphaerales bacterium]
MAKRSVAATTQPVGTPDTLTPDEFADALRGSFRTLWLIAVGVTGDRTLAEDVVQEAAIVGLEKIDRFQPGSSFVAWMGQTVRFVALNMARKERKQFEAVRESGRRPERRSDSLAEWSTPRGIRLTQEVDLPEDQRSFDDRLMGALDEMSETARACLLLRTIEDLPYSEIARILDIPEGTAMSHVHRARRSLRDRLEPQKTKLKPSRDESPASDRSPG